MNHQLVKLIYCYAVCFLAAAGVLFGIYRAMGRYTYMEQQGYVIAAVSAVLWVVHWLMIRRAASDSGKSRRDDQAQ